MEQEDSCKIALWRFFEAIQPLKLGITYDQLIDICKTFKVNFIIELNRNYLEKKKKFQ